MAGKHSSKINITITMYGVAEILKWCVDKNNGRIPGVDTEGFQHMKASLAEKPDKGDYFTFDKFWKTSKTFEFTTQEVATIDQCLYDIPNLEGKQLPQIRYKFWPAQQAG